MKPLRHFGQPAALFSFGLKKTCKFFLRSLPHFQTKPLHDFLPLLLGRIYRLRNQQMAGQEIYVNQTPFSDIPSLPMPKTMWHLGGPLRLMRNQYIIYPNHRAGGISGLHNLKASMDNFNFIYWYGSITHSVRDIAAKAPLSYTSFLI